MGVKLAAASGGSVELVPANTASNYTITMPASTGTVLTTTSPKTGNVLQVVSTTKTSVFSTTSTGAVDITGMSATITPSSSSSKILVMVKLMTGNSGAQNTGFTFQLYRDATQINLGDAAGSRSRGFSGSEEGISSNSYGQYQSYDYCTQFLDSPGSASALTYKITVYLTNTNTFFINSTAYDSDLSAYPRGTSNIILMEIAG